MQSIKAILLHATTQLKACSPEPESANLEAQLLLSYALKTNRAWLIAYGDDALPAQDTITFEALLARRLAGEPIAYILEYREFYGLKLKVTPDTLIPRPDTETLVDAALAKIPSHQSLQVLDLGTGTGAVALAIAQHRPKCAVTAIDVSPMALAVATENIQHLMISNLTLIQSNWFEALGNMRFDTIVSNPPYIAVNDQYLIQGDLRFEPISALISGSDGLMAIRHIIKQAVSHLNEGGWLILEHGFQQASTVSALMRTHGFRQPSHAHDLAGIVRVTLGQYK